MEEFLNQVKLHWNTENENGDAISYLMQNWYDMSKDDLAHIAIEAMFSAEHRLKVSNVFVKDLYNSDIADFYGDLYENLYIPED